MKKLSQIVAGDFSATIRQRGSSYFRTRKVKIVEGNDELVRATVRGGGVYKVVLTREDDSVEASCTCPYVVNYGDLCKHIWAVILQCDNTKFLQGSGLPTDLTVSLAGLDEDDEYEDDEYEDDEDEDDDEDEGEDEETPQEIVRRRWAKASAVTSVREFLKKATAQKQGKAKKETVKKEQSPEWKKILGTLSANAAAPSVVRNLDWPPTRELLYLVDMTTSMSATGLIVDLAVRHRRKDGNWTKLTSARFSSNQLHQLPDEKDRQILTVLLGAKEHYNNGYYTSDDHQYASFPRYQLTPTLQRMLLPVMCATGRCKIRQYEGQEDCPTLAWDEGAPYQFGLKVTRDEAKQQYLVTGLLQRETADGAEILPMDAPLMMTASGLLFTTEKIAALEHGNAFQWLALLRKKQQVVVPFQQGQEFIENALKQPEVPHMLLPDELQFAETTLTPQPCVKLVKSQNFGWTQKINAEVSFKYEDRLIDRDDRMQGVYLPERRLFIRRNHALEAAALEELRDTGFHQQTYYYSPKPVLEIATNKVPRVVRELVAAGWSVEAEGKLYRSAGSFNVSVSSGIDWFEMHGTVDYGGVTATLPQLLAALKRGENTVKLGDGTFGLLPEEWLKKYGMIAGLGKAEDDHIRFKKSQAGFLDALLATQPDVSFDEAFGRVRDELRSFAGIEAGREPQGFTGELRAYQRDALGWFDFLRRFGFGGCLADDMGLGKCVAADSLIYVNGKLITAESLWNDYAVDAEFDGEGWWAAPSAELVTNSIDENHHCLTPTRVRRLYRQRVSEPLRRITLEDGSTLTVTRRHHLLTSRGWSRDLRPEDYVCVPARLLWNGQKVNSDLVTLLAWQIAEGYELLNVASVKISQKDTGRLKELRLCALRVAESENLEFNTPRVHARNDGRVPVLTINSVAWRRWLEARGYQWGKLSQEKSFPDFLMQADDETVRVLLRNFFDAEASVAPGMRSVEISTASPVLMQQLSVLLRRFGIWLRISVKQKCATNGHRIYRTYYCGVLGGNSARRFHEQIGFGITDKQQKLADLCRHLVNTNVEGLPASELVAEAVSFTGLPVRHFGMHSTVYLNGSQQFSRVSLQRVTASMDRLLSGEMQHAYQQLKASKWTAGTSRRLENIDHEKLLATRQQLQALLDREVWYCRIKSVEDVPYDGWVYDLEITDHHNFVAGQMLCHNTIQVLALLESRRELRAQSEPSVKVSAQEVSTPSLAVLPKSLVFNWKQEAARFTPALRVLDHTGQLRVRENTTHFENYDLILTTYGTLRNDAALFRDINFDYLILDEAQAIKNSTTVSAKAARLLNGNHRLALSGTPIENHLGELWSLFDFLNPGLLGASSTFSLGAGKNPDEETRKMLAQALRPFILRRTKDQVAKDLPPKLEQTIYCELEPAQQKQYDELRDHYRAALLGKIDEVGINKSKMHILEALLRLRQAACHPGLLDKKKEHEASAKLDVLLPQLQEVLDEGHKALVFSQFTSFLAILRKHLDKDGIAYEYLDGKTKDRQGIVQRFQNDPESRLFLISLKAGGLGLNLTAAEYVFLLDPWWNPAVEAQAIDRAHRIGQARNVFAYRLIAKGTVEEKVLELQNTKRDLADAIINADNSLIRSLKREDLELLLS